MHKFYGTKWPLCADVPLSNHSFICVPHLTHCFLLKGEDPPQCIACDCQLTVKHILFECVDFIESRNRHFSVNSFRELFEKVPPDSILSYLHEIGLFYRL